MKHSKSVKMSCWDYC